MSDFTERMARLEESVATLVKERDRYTAPSRRADDALSRGIARSGREWIALPLDFVQRSSIPTFTTTGDVTRTAFDAPTVTTQQLADVVATLVKANAAQGLASFKRTGYRSIGGSRVFKVLLVAGTAFTRNATHFWTIGLRVVADVTGDRAAEEFGVEKTSIALDLISLPAGIPVGVYDDPVGFAMADGDRLRAHVAATGSPAALTDAVLFVEVQRNARQG